MKKNFRSSPSPNGGGSRKLQRGSQTRCYRALKAGYGLYIALDCFVRYITPPSLVPEDPEWYGKLLDSNRVKAWEKWGFDVTAALLHWPKKITVSLCMIVRNEESTLDSCFSSIRDYVDEIILVDTGSTDRTKEIASRYKSRIYDFEWVDDFARARKNRAIPAWKPDTGRAVR